jgi:hypothetical protein
LSMRIDRPGRLAPRACLTLARPPALGGQRQAKPSASGAQPTSAATAGEANRLQRLHAPQSPRHR